MAVLVGWVEGLGAHAWRLLRRASLALLAVALAWFSCLRSLPVLDVVHVILFSTSLGSVDVGRLSCLGLVEYSSVRARSLSHLWVLHLHLKVRPEDVLRLVLHLYAF